MFQSHDSAFLSASPFVRWSWFALCLLGGALGFGCKPSIGDSCTVSTNCSTAGDRLCDITQPGGYCTVFNCEPGSCPEESVCINFGTTLSSVQGCAPSQANSPYQRSFCMARCSSDGDCRADYECLDLSGAPGKPSNRFGAVLAETSGSGRVCVAKTKAVAPTLEVYDGGTMSNEVCSVSSGGVGSSGGAGSMPAAAGAGGMGAAGDAGSSSDSGAAGN